ncbi:MAG: hypothetical protein EHM64_04280 [Ignavibacteriae bacterium]|nr:MAG: hypothetical protein EHM64_04280 [Ignavibacteriota bacterium]
MTFASDSGKIPPGPYWYHGSLKSDVLQAFNDNAASVLTVSQTCLPQKSAFHPFFVDSALIFSDYKFNIIAVLVCPVKKKL